MEQQKGRRLIGLTGSIGSGKTTVAKYMKRLGAHVISADIVSRNALLPSSKLIPQIREAFGDGVFLYGNAVDRRRLAEAVFDDNEKLIQLNAITHPYIRDQMLFLAETEFRINHAHTVVFDAPLLVETGLHVYCDDVWVVVASAGTRKNRIIARDRTTEENAVKRILARMSDDNLVRYADVVIENNGTEEELLNKVNSTYIERHMNRNE